MLVQQLISIWLKDFVSTKYKMNAYIVLPIHLNLSFKSIAKNIMKILSRE